MPELTGLYISSHAVEQFQQRIAPIQKARVRVFIREGIRHSMNFNLLPDGNTLRIRTRRPFPFEFRAMCVFDQARQGWVVATILRGDNKVTRKQKRRLATMLPAGEQMQTREGEVCKTMPLMPSLF